MHNRQILFLSRAVVSKDLPRNPVLPDPKWSRKSRSGRLAPVLKGIFCFIWRSSRIPRAAPPAPAPARPASCSPRRKAPRAVTAPRAGPANEKGPSGKEGPLGDLEAKPGFEPGVKALQASALPLGHFAVDMKRADSKTGPMHAMERTTGLEPATPTLARLCSTN